MKDSLRTNKVVCKIDYKEFFKNYTVLASKYNRYTDVIDFSSNLKNNYPKDLLAHYTDGKSRNIYILLNEKLHKIGTNRTLFYNDLFSSADFGAITDENTLKRYCVSPDSVTLNLLLNHVASDDALKETEFSSVLGRAYFRLNEDKEEGVYRFLEFSFDEDLVLTDSLRTFTEYEKASNFLSDPKLNKKTKYSIDNYRLVFGCGNPCLVLFSEKKGHSDFFDLRDPSKTKVSYYELVMSHLRDRLSQFSSEIDFSYKDGYKKIELTSNFKNKNQFPKRFFGEDTNIFSRVVISTNSNTIPFSEIHHSKDEFLSKVELLKDKLCNILPSEKIYIEDSFPENFDKETFYINLILSKEQYKNLEEDHYISSISFNIQNITINSLFSLNEETLIRQILKELMIKKDVVNEVVSIEDFLLFPEDIVDFYIKERKENGEDFLVHCKISDDKKLRFSYESDDMNMFLSNTEYIFKTKDNITGICSKTSELSLPHTDVIKTITKDNDEQRLRTGRVAKGKGPRSRQFVENNIPEVFDITYYTENENLYYFVGDARAGFKDMAIHNSNPIRKITFSNENYSLDGAFFDSMNTDLLSALDASVRPFLYKYCLEWHRINSKSESV